MRSIALVVRSRAHFPLGITVSGTEVLVLREADLWACYHLLILWPRDSERVHDCVEECFTPVMAIIAIAVVTAATRLPQYIKQISSWLEFVQIRAVVVKVITPINVIVRVWALSIVENEHLVGTR